jgi:myo-inositol 2-dehydrogenase/D-chiro-inositol 1-dehydrogenase/scyllo-inositol 2-dehydrogenase (NAD+)
MLERIRVCLAGAGRAGQVHANSLVHHIPGAELSAIVDSHEPALQECGERFGVAARFATLEQALESTHFDAVVITTPTFTHRDLTLLAASQGKHVLCEKPMALSLAECDQMIAAAEKAGTVLQIGFMRRFDPDFTAAMARIEAGEIGRPTLIKSLTHGPGLPPPWARDLHTSNGMLAEVNSHDWDAVRWFAFSNPRRIYAEIGNFKGAARGVDTPHFYDAAIVAMRFDNETLGSLSGVCPCDYGYDARMEIVGEKGIIQIGEMRGQSLVVCTSREQGLVTPIYRTWPHRFADAYILEMRHFLDCIRRGLAPRASATDGRWAVASVLAATRSLLEERPVFLDEVLK